MPIRWRRGAARVLTCLVLVGTGAVSVPAVAARPTMAVPVVVADTGAVRDGGFEQTLPPPLGGPVWRFTGDSTRATGVGGGDGSAARLCGAPRCVAEVSQVFDPSPADGGSLVLTFRLRVETAKPPGRGCEDILRIELAVGAEPAAPIGRSCDEAVSDAGRPCDRPATTPARADACGVAIPVPGFAEHRIDVTAFAGRAAGAARPLVLGFGGRTDGAAAATTYLIDDVALLREDRPPGPANARVSAGDGAFSAYSEPSVAADPADPRRLVGAAKFFTDNPGYGFRVGTFGSADGGRTWVEHGPLPGLAAFAITSDPVVAFGPDGVAYVSLIGVPGDGAPASRPWGVFVYRSDDGGRTFAGPATVDRGAGDDKPWLAIDRSNGPNRGAVYVVWVRACRTFLSRSADGRSAFTPRRLVLNACAGAQVAVGPNGEVIVLAPVYAPTGRNARFELTVSRDGGATWNEPRVVARVVPMPTTLGGGFRAATLPALAMAPDTGDVLVAWNDPRDDTPDIWLTRSTDGGARFGDPIRVHRETAGDQFQPAIVAGVDGAVIVSWFDRATDPENRMAEVVIARSADSGASFGPTMRVSTQRFDPALTAPTDGNGLGFFGDYQGLTLAGAMVVPFWNDPRTGLQAIYAARLAVAFLPADGSPLSRLTAPR